MDLYSGITLIEKNCFENAVYILKQNAKNKVKIISVSLRVLSGDYLQRNVYFCQKDASLNFKSSVSSFRYFCIIIFAGLYY
jgi:hypothetical protein